MMFEVQDLAVASPATVSRCGMVYLEPSILGLLPFIECWLNLIPEALKPFSEQLKSLFARFLQVRAAKDPPRILSGPLGLCLTIFASVLMLRRMPSHLSARR